MVRIRQAIAEDTYAVGVVHVAAWQYAYKDLLADILLQQQSVANRASWWNSYVKDPVNWPLFVAEHNSSIVGFASIMPARDDDVDGSVVAELAAIYLLEAFSRRGIGAQLLEHCVGAAHRRGCRSVVLWVLAGNEAAMGFYKTHGFVEDGASKQHGRFQVDELRFRLETPVFADVQAT